MPRASLDTLRYLRRALAGRPPRCLAGAYYKPTGQHAQLHCQQRHPQRLQRAHLSSSRPASSASPSRAPSEPADSPSPPQQPQTYYTFFPQTLSSGAPPHGPFTPNLAALRHEFLRLQAQTHPDLRPPAERPAAQQRSAALNEAYRVLCDPVKRAEYLLSLRPEGSTSSSSAAAENAAAQAQTGQQGGADETQALLHQVLFIREELDDPDTPPSRVAALRAENEARIKESLDVLGRAFERDDLPAARRELDKLRYWGSLAEAFGVLEERERLKGKDGRGREILLQH